MGIPQRDISWTYHEKWGYHGSIMGYIYIIYIYNYTYTVYNQLEDAVLSFMGGTGILSGTAPNSVREIFFGH